MKSRQPRKIKCIETGEVFNSLHEASRKYGRHYTNLSQIIQHNLPLTWAGLHWEALTPTQIVEFVATNSDGEERVFDTRIELAKFLGVSLSTIKYHIIDHEPVKGYILERKITNKG